MTECCIRQEAIRSAARYLHDKEIEKAAKREERWTYLTCGLGIALIVVMLFL